MDRNARDADGAYLVESSLSARRAWIEMSWLHRSISRGSVALRKESVDRNRLSKKNRPSVSRSLSARRAWIEIR